MSLLLKYTLHSGNGKWQQTLLVPVPKIQFLNYNFQMWIAQMGANVSWANIKRLSNVLFPPSSQILADLLMGGYLDATNFLATYGFVKNCPMCLTVKTVIKKSPLKMYEVRDE